jgi:hypothetical protein
METTDVEIQGAIWSFSHDGDFEGSLIADDGFKLTFHDAPNPAVGVAIWLQDRWSDAGYTSVAFDYNDDALTITYDGEPAEPIPKPIYNNFRAIVDVSGDAGVDLTNDSFDFVEFLGEPGGVSGDALDIAESFQLVAVAASGSTGTPDDDVIDTLLPLILDARIEVGEFVDSITLLPGSTTSFSDDFIL